MQIYISLGKAFKDKETKALMDAKYKFGGGDMQSYITSHHKKLQEIFETVFPQENIESNPHPSVMVNFLIFINAYLPLGKNIFLSKKGVNNNDHPISISQCTINKKNIIMT